jgi:MFS family permease
MARRRSVELTFLIRAAWGLAIATTALSLAPNLVLALAAVMPVGACTIFLVSGANSVVQLRADSAMRGRALALTTVVFIGSTPIGGPIAGWVSEQFGARAGLMMGAVATAVVALWVTRHAPAAQLQRAPEEPAIRAEVVGRP